ncbi:uncharacterized protein PHALS_05403 [Plasmopara halstedii]|uniref:Uncharacterized protein n=1 Tax=Plasmopara halstedii TaxID=4781 RepID=A0A0P1AA27_PLAHL|nr:uncharacterized protein PHALS_05403 [Plasmopara halstedii]CEG37624.1 hypothetical protein PHALS_05403 [Plasmopara halstedii]|eukprot:XP_024573993.1 hypothetical protein PHALS_05403 [Plasmopara halstedii]
MSFPTLSRRHVATPLNRSKRRSHGNSNNSTKLTKSPQNCVRSESLRSTWMTNGSDSMEEEDEDLSQESDAESDALQIVSQSQKPLSDWAYWQRDAVALPDCWTRVYAVFCRNILWLYRYEDASANSLLVCMRVMALDVGTDCRQLKFRDGVTATSVQLYMSDLPALDRWHNHVSIAMAMVSEVEKEERSRALIVPAVASAVKHKIFWKELATAVVSGIQPLSSGHNPSYETNSLVVHDSRRKKSMRQHWTYVTTALKNVLKRNRQYPQLQYQEERR